MSSGLAEKGITALGLARTAPATLVALAYNPDKPLATAYVLSDTQAVPAGTAEGGTCPEPGTLDQCPTTNVANPGELPSPFQVVSACASPTPSPAATPTAAPASPEPAASAPATASASAAPSPSPSPSTNPAFGCESPSPSPGGGGGGGSNGLLLGVVVVILGLLAVVLVVRVFFSRR